MSKKKSSYPKGAGRSGKKGSADAGRTVGLSTKSYKPPRASAKSAASTAEVKAERAPMSRRAKIITASVALLLLVAIAAGIVAGVLIYIDKTHMADYLNEDLSKYMTLDRSAYDGFEVKINIPAVTKREVENAILKALASKKGAMLYDGSYLLEETLRPGDKAYIWYRGYELSEDGVETELDGTCNFFDEDPEELELGSGKFVTGFELDLVGKMAYDTSRFVKYTAGEIYDTDTVYIVATCAQEVGDFYAEANIRLDLADPKLEEVWGEGIREYIKGIGLGNKSTELKELKTPGKTEQERNSVTFTSVEVKFATREEGEAQPVTVKTVFPHNYKDESFRNKTVYFDVYIEETLHYDSPRYNEEFIKSLGFDAQSLAAYEGITLMDKYESKLRRELEDARQQEIDDAVEDAVWANMVKCAVFHKIPQGDVTAAYNDYYNRLKSEYRNSFSDSYSTLDDFMIANFQLEKGADWQAHMRELVSQDVKEKLLYFYVLQQEGLIPTEQEFDTAYREYLEESYYDAYKKGRDDFPSNFAYESALSKFESNMKLAKGEEYINDVVYYNMHIGDIVGKAKVVNLAQQGQ